MIARSSLRKRRISCVWLSLDAVRPDEQLWLKAVRPGLGAGGILLPRKVLDRTEPLLARSRMAPICRTIGRWTSSQR
jgi:hypothetical protein